MLLEIAVGDGYGRPFEFNTREFIDNNNDMLGYKHREGENVTGIGIYTDDTQMTLGIVDKMLLFPTVSTQIRYAVAFVNAYKRDPRGGYSKRVRNALELTSTDKPFELVINSNAAGASSNGSVMRAIPLGLLSDPKQVIHDSILHTSVTHGSVQAINATVAVALTAHYFYHIHTGGGNFTDWEKWMAEQMGHDVFNNIFKAFSPDSVKELQCDAIDTASLSIALAWTSTSLSNVIKKAVSIGGDVDSSAAVGAGLYSLRKDHVSDMPKVLINNLENGKFGRDFIIAKDIELFKKFPRKT